jgi:hypothetical protein
LLNSEIPDSEQPDNGIDALIVDEDGKKIADNVRNRMTWISHYENTFVPEKPETAEENLSTALPQSLQEIANASPNFHVFGMPPIAESPKQEQTETPKQAEQTKPKTPRTRAERLYVQFEKMFPNIVSGKNSHERYGNLGDAFERVAPNHRSFSVEHLGGNRYGYMTWFMQEGDLMRDPDLTFTLDHETRTLNILEYQIDDRWFGATRVPPTGTVYQCVHDDNGNSDEKLLVALEQNFMQNLKNAEEADRPLTEYTFKDENGKEVREKTEFAKGEERENYGEYEEENYSKPDEKVAENADKSALLRETLNDFSNRHGLGELNLVERDGGYRDVRYFIVEKLRNGEEFELGELTEKPPLAEEYTAELLQKALTRLESEVTARDATIEDRYGRLLLIERQGGVTPLPKVQENLPKLRMLRTHRTSFTIT